MNRCNEVCSVCNSSTSSIQYACTCGDPVVFICKNCLIVHLAEQSTHTFISLLQAQELVRNRISPEDLNRNLSKYNSIKLQIQKYIKKLRASKQDIAEFKHQVITQIEQKCRSSVEILSLLEEKAQTQLQALKSRMKTFADADDRLLSDFKLKGLKAVIPDYIENIRINRAQISTAIEEMISFSSADNRPYLLTPLPIPQIPQAQPQPTQAIFVPRQKSKKIISYCPANASISEYDLSSFIVNPFQYTSTCMLPDGNVLIVGGYGPIHGDTYKLNTANSDVIKLKGLNYPRCEVRLYCDDKSVYALGGYNSCDLNKAEKMEWRGNGWETLPDMIHPRNYFGTYYRYRKLYCIGGRDTSSIEYYDFISNTFKLLHNVSVASGANIVGEVDNRIYLLNKHAVTFSRSFKRKDEKEDINSSNFLNLSDVIIQGKEVIFYCIGSNRVYSYNVASSELKKVIAIK